MELRREAGSSITEDADVVAHPQGVHRRPPRDIRPPPHLSDYAVGYLPMAEPCRTHLPRAEDVQLLLVVKEEVSPEVPEPPPHIKEEQEELWSSQEGEQLQGRLEEAEITKFTFTPVPVKSEDDEEKLQSSQLHQRQTEHMETEADGEDCGGPEAARNSDPERHLHPDTEDKTGDSSEPETEDSDDWKESREPLSELSAGEKPFRCSECGKTLRRKENLKRHMKTHTGEKTFSCSVCRSSFTRSRYLQLHMRIHTGGKPFSCSVCDQRFVYKAYLKRHLITHTGEKPFNCSFCKKSFTRSGDLQLHMKIHTGGKPYSCSVCDQRFVYKAYLQRHMRFHTGEKPYSCSVCKKSFTRSGDLQRHMKIHTGEKPYSCSVCDKAFGESGNLKRHMRSHTGTDQRFTFPGDVHQLLVVKEEVPPELQDPEPPPHIKEEQEELWSSQEGEQLQGLEEADIIKFTFTPVPVKSEDDEEKPQSSQLHQRQTEHMEKEADGEDCGGLETARNSDPERHLHPDTEDKTGNSSETDDSDGDWESREPPAGSNSLGNEEVPVSDSRSSAGEKPFSCSKCGKRFGHKGSLKVHMRTHTGEKPYSCSVCKKSFAQSSNLQLHMRIHTGEKPFSCPLCDKAFSVNGNLKVHMRYHTREKPFSCSVCGKAFSVSGNLKEHLRSHTREKRFSCSVCDQRFTLIHQLWNHKCVHQSETEERQNLRQQEVSEEH